MADGNYARMANGLDRNSTFLVILAFTHSHSQTHTHSSTNTELGRQLGVQFLRSYLEVSAVFSAHDSRTKKYS